MPKSYEIRWWGSTPFVGIQLMGLFGPIFTGISWAAAGIALVLYVVRMFLVTAVYHRYFSHRSYKMGRLAQFLAAFATTSCVQKGPLWWASHHRDHHRFSDQPRDPHSVKVDGLFWAHIGWILSKRYQATDLKAIHDFARFRELRWLNRKAGYLIAPALLALFCAWLGSWLGPAYHTSAWQMLIVSFFTSTFVLAHGTFLINSLAHLLGTQRYNTGDESRNHWLLAVITMGEGWHNNHHDKPSDVRQAVTKRELCLDWTYWGLWFLEKIGIISDLRRPVRSIPP